MSIGRCRIPRRRRPIAYVAARFGGPSTPRGPTRATRVFGVRAARRSGTASTGSIT